MKLGRYEVVRELGKGAMGVVYLAKDPLIGRLVALKTIRSAQGDDDEAREFQQRFIREAQAAGILNHPAIVTVHDIGQDEATGINFIAMEYVEGQNLKEVLSQGRALSFDQIGEVIAEVAEALDFAHSKGIVHRDVKPANIILLEGNRTKITDFGIAKIASGGANLTSTGQFLGTPNYMAPEQIKGAPVDGRTDIFSLGICLYECLTRRKPFGGDSLTSISYKIVHEGFPSLREINPQIPEGYEEVVGTSLAKDPAQRYQRAKDFAAALRAVVRGERPVRAEKILEEDTIVTREDRLPTIEQPFPEAMDPVGASMTRPVIAGAGVAAPAIALPSIAPRKPLAAHLRKTITDVRAMPQWRRPVHPLLFFGIVGVLVAALLAGMVTIRRAQPVVPRVDTVAESRRARERQLRIEGNALLRQGRVAEAHDRYVELSKLAPRSPAVTLLVERLGAIRQREEIGKQQLAASQEKLDAGLALYKQQKFSESVPLFQEAFSLNPNNELAASYLKLAQFEIQRIDMERAARQQKKSGRVPPAAVAAGGQQPAPAAAPSVPAQLTTVFASPFADGYIMVRAGAELVTHENLWEEKGRALFRRRAPRTVNVTKQVSASNTDIHVWVVVPSQKIQEHNVIRHSFAPGSSQRLQVTFNASSKTFDYQLN